MTIHKLISILAIIVILCCDAPALELQGSTGGITTINTATTTTLTGFLTGNGTSISAVTTIADSQLSAYMQATAAITLLATGAGL